MDSEVKEEQPLLPKQPKDSPEKKTLYTLRVLYFLSGLTGSTFGRLESIYLHDIAKLSKWQIGKITGMVPLIMIFSQPFWGIVSDKVGSTKWIYIFVTFCNTLFLVSLSFPFVYCSYTHILILNIGMAIFSCNGVIDAYTLSFLGTKHRSWYGSIRLYMAASWGGGAFVMGIIATHLGFNVNFILFGVFSLFNLCLCAAAVPNHFKKSIPLEEINPNDPIGGVILENEEASDLSDNDSCTFKANSVPEINEVLGDTENLIPRERTQSMLFEKATFSEFLRLLFSIKVLMWLIHVSILGAGMAVVEQLLFVYIISDLQGTAELCGYTVVITVLFELPVFHYEGFMLKKFGHDGLFMFAALAYSLRVFAYTLLTPSTRYYILPIELFHGITFACFWVSSVKYAHGIAPKGWEAAFQTLLTTSSGGIGRGIGTIVGGYVFEKYGGIFLYRGAAFIMIGVLLFHLIIRLCGYGYDYVIKKHNHNLSLLDTNL